MRTLITAMFTLLLAGQALAENPVYFKKWTLEKVANNEESYVQLWADSDSQSPPGAFYIYRDSGSCLKPVLAAVVSMPKKGTDSDWADGALRVDEKVIHSFKYSCTFPKNNGTAVVTIKEISNLPSLGEEMRQGSYLRLKLQVSGQDVFLRIPLSGFGEANFKQMDDCETLPATAKKSQ